MGDPGRQLPDAALLHLHRALGRSRPLKALLSERTVVPLSPLADFASRPGDQAGDDPAGDLFIGLACVYVAEFFATLGPRRTQSQPRPNECSAPSTSAPGYGSCTWCSWLRSCRCNRRDRRGAPAGRGPRSAPTCRPRRSRPLARMLSAFLVSSTRVTVRAHSSAVEHSPYKRGVTGSNPVAPTRFLQLDGLFGTLIGGSVTTAGNHRCMLPCREVPRGHGSIIFGHEVRRPTSTAGTTGVPGSLARRPLQGFRT